MCCLFTISDRIDIDLFHILCHCNVVKDVSIISSSKIACFKAVNSTFEGILYIE